MMLRQGMMPTIRYLIILFLLTPLLIVPIVGQSEKAIISKGWEDERSYITEYDDGSYVGSFSLRPQVFWNGTDWDDFEFVPDPTFASVDDCRYFVRNSHIALEICDNYVKIWNPEYTQVSVYNEQWSVEYYTQNKWKDTGIGYQLPIWVIDPWENGVNITRIHLLQPVGQLAITYTIMAGMPLKHSLHYTNRYAEEYQFRAIMRLHGITDNRLIIGNVTTIINLETHVITDGFFVGENMTNLVFHENLGSLGEWNETDGSWSSDVLQDIEFNTHANGMKADITIGNYTLVPLGTFLIDPDSSSWQVSASYDDSYTQVDMSIMRPPPDPYTNFPTSSFVYYGYNYLHGSLAYCSGFRFTSINIDSGDLIDNATLSLSQTYYAGSPPCNAKLYCEDIDDASDFNVGQVNTYLRTKTTANIAWDTGTGTGWKYSPNMNGSVQEVVDRGGWSSGNDIMVLYHHRAYTGTFGRSRSYDYSTSLCAKLNLTWHTPISEIWNAVENWTGQLVTRDWTDVENWTGQLNTRIWTGVENWTGQLVTRAWETVENWTGQLVTRTWETVENWTGQLITRSWLRVENWTGQLGSRMWNTVENWTGQLITYSWNVIENWTGQLVTRAWTTVENWTGQLITYSWNVIETWTGQFQGVGWRLVEVWTGILWTTNNGFLWVFLVMFLTVIAITVLFVVLRSRE